MNKLKLLSLTIAGISMLSAASFAQSFPVTYKGVVTTSAPDFSLFVNGVEVDSLAVDFGTVKVGEEVKIEQGIIIKKGDVVVSAKDLNYSLKNTTLDNEIGSVTAYVTNAYEQIYYVGTLTGKKPGTFNASTELLITEK